MKKNANSRKVSGFPMAGMLLSGVLIVAGVFFAPPPASSEPQKAVPDSMAQVQLSYAPVVKKVAPAVVNVYSKRVVQTGVSPFFSDPFFQRFFGQDWGGVPQQRIQNSLGSGVIVDPDGIIVTNHHVIAEGEEFRVVLHDRREFEAKLILDDERTDLAILKIDDPDKKPLPHLSFANSDLAEVGDIVLAIGNPFGVGQTVTSGIISAVARTSQGISDYQFFIQTDAAINPGNSGGALVNMAGELVGINSAIYTRSGGSNGIGFAIPGNMVRNVVETAVAGGHEVARPWVGVKAQAIDTDLAKSLGLDRPTGVIVNAIHPQSPFAKLGLKSGDVILKVGEFEIYDPQGLNYRIATHKIGETVDITYMRDHKVRLGKLKLTKAPEVPAANLTAVTGNNPLNGMTIANLSPAFADKIGADWDEKGVVVADIDPNSMAAQLGFRPGDVLAEINGSGVENVHDVVQMSAQNPKVWNLVVLRGGRTLKLSFRL